MSRQIGHVTDIMATCVELAGARHPENFEGHSISPLEGHSLQPIFEGKVRPHPAPIFWEHEGNRAVRLGQWKLVALHRRDWELYDVEADRTEQNNLAARYPERVKEMSATYDQWARRCQVLPPEELPPARPIPAAGKTAPR
jgi:arylsulfatase